jgi:hypothetical protein
MCFFPGIRYQSFKLPDHLTMRSDFHFSAVERGEAVKLAKLSGDQDVVDKPLQPWFQVFVQQARPPFDGSV